MLFMCDKSSILMKDEIATTSRQKSFYQRPFSLQTIQAANIYLPKSLNSRASSRKSASIQCASKSLAQSDNNETEFIHNLNKSKLRSAPSSKSLYLETRLPEYIRQSSFLSRREKQITDSIHLKNSLFYSTQGNLIRSKSCVDIEKLSPKQSSTEPDIHKITREKINHMAVSMESRKQSTLLGRPMERSNRLNDKGTMSRISTVRRTSMAETRRSRSLLRGQEEEQQKLSVPSNNYRDSARQRQSRRHSINPAYRTLERYNRNIKSNKSTEGSKVKDSDYISEEDTSIDEEACLNDSLDEGFYRRISMWVDTVDRHIKSGDFDRKVIMESSEMNYKDDIPRPLSAEDHRPGNYHTVTIVQYDENNH